MKRLRYFLWLLCGFIGHPAAIAQMVSTFPLNEEKLVYAQDVESKALATRDSSLMAEAYYLYGKVYAMAGDYQSSQRFFLSSLRIQQIRGDTSAMARLYTRLSENENSQGHYPEAMDHARKAIAFARYSGKNERLGPAYTIMGRVYESIWEATPQRSREWYDSTLHYYTMVREGISEKADELERAAAQVSLGRLLLKNNDREAIPYLQNAVDLFRKKAQLFQGVPAGAYLATAYLHFGEIDKGREWLQLTQKYYDDNALNDFETSMQLLRGWMEYYRKTGDLQTALEYSEQIRHTEKKQFLADRAYTLDKLAKEYKAEQTGEELKVQKQRMDLLVRNYRLQRVTTLSLGVLMTVSLMAGLFYYKLYRKNQRLSLQNARLVREQGHRLNNQLQMAGNLLSLQSRNVNDARAKDAIQKSRMRLQAIALLQRRLYAEGKESASGAVDLPVYVDELIRMVLDACGYSHISRSVNVAPIHVAAEVVLPLALILNELMTNSCKYAFPGHSSPYLKVSCHKEGNRVQLTVADNGPGFDPSVLQNSASFGMQLIQIQAEQLYGDYGFYHDKNTQEMMFTIAFTC